MDEIGAAHCPSNNHSLFRLHQKSPNFVWISTEPSKMTLPYIWECGAGDTAEDGEFLRKFLLS